MLHRIDPLVDCVFKALLGDPHNIDLLIHFLNAVLRLDDPIVQAEILNPYNPVGSPLDKLTIVDVKARDTTGRMFQVEVQLAVTAALRERMVYTASHVLHGQLTKGQPYTALAPVYAIWILDEVLLKESPGAHHRFRLHDPEHKITLSQHLCIHTLELPKFNLPLDESGQPILDAEGSWLYFLKEARAWDELPEILDTPVMRKAMSVLRFFSDEQREYHLYQSRLDRIRLERTLEESRRQTEEHLARALEETAKAEEDKARAEEDKARAEEDKTRAEEDKARAEEEAEKLRQALTRAEQLLRQAGIDPSKDPSSSSQ